MSLISKTRTAPIPHEPDRAAEAVAAFATLPDNLRALIGGTAGCSPYLRGLLLRERDWLLSVLDCAPTEVIAGVFAAVGDAPDNLARGLRLAKRRIALYTALADLGGMWTLAEVTAALSDFADFALQSSLTSLVAAELERGKLPGCLPADLSTACGICVLAMGKLGARELNYSSDIDLIVLFDETRHAEADFEEIRERFIRITRRMARMLSDVTAEGYVFRTDLRLRPDPSVTPVCLSMGAAERYYESLGRTWERAAFIKARPCAGDVAAGGRFLQTLRPFIWRKHLDYAAIQDAHDMRLLIREHKGLGGRISLPGHNLKLGRGGIREIEFFTQTRQIIAGGRDPDLRQRGTIAGLQMLAQKGWIDPAVAAALADAYTKHRTLEHRIQMLNDAQTHDIPTSPAQIARLADFYAVPSPEAFEGEVLERLEQVAQLTEAFFAPEDAPNDPLAGQPPQTRTLIEGWYGCPALRTQRANTIFRRILPLILKRVAQTASPAQTLDRFGGFLTGLPAGVQVFSLFEANPHLIDLLVDICGAAPVLAKYLSQNSHVLDAVITGRFFDPLPDAAGLSAELGHVLEGLRDYEDQLNAARRWMKEQHFRIGVQHLKQMIPATQAARCYSDLAEACLSALFAPVANEFARRFGPMPGRGAMVLGMGSLAARMMSARSDLDLIVIYDAEGAEFSQGKRPLAVSTYFARFTQALVTALSSPMSEGMLYDVDMRLRPSGRKGPVATALSGFFTYQQQDAWTWEHMALTRARPVAGSPSLCVEVESFRQEIIGRRRDLAALKRDAREMRARIAAAIGHERADDPWEAKAGPGRMMDIELLAQTTALATGCPVRDTASQLEGAVQPGWLDATEMAALRQDYARLAALRQIAKLLVNSGFDPAGLGPTASALLLGETNARTLAALETALAAGAARADALIGRILAA